MPADHCEHVAQFYYRKAREQLCEDYLLGAMYSTLSRGERWFTRYHNARP